MSSERSSSSSNADRAMVVTDLDGTLLGTARGLPGRSREALEELGRRGIARVVATGRSLHSARKALHDGFPIDYLVFSSGAGIAGWRDGRILHARELAPRDLSSAIEAFLEAGHDFMVHAPIPENHRFLYRRARESNPDFDARIERYAEFAAEWSPGAPWPARASQCLAVVPEGEAREAFADARERLPGLKVIRATSPLDHRSAWVEVFPPDVSKAAAAARILALLGNGAGPEACLAVGNDYNDEDLLDWAGSRYVVANAPEELRLRYPCVASSDEGGFADAVARWLRTGV